MKFLKILLILFIMFSCSTDNKFPYYPVYLEFNITANAPQLSAFNGFKEFLKPENISQRLGLGGILIFHTIEDKFYAFDMACPFEKETDVKVRCNNAGIVICDKCKSQFYVGDGLGFTQSGLSRQPLKKYKVYCESSIGNILVVN